MKQFVNNSQACNRQGGKGIGNVLQFPMRQLLLISSTGSNTAVISFLWQKKYWFKDTTRIAYIPRNNNYYDWYHILRDMIVYTMIYTQSLLCFVCCDDIMSFWSIPMIDDSYISRLINSSPPSAPFMHRWIGSALVRVMVVAYSAPSHSLKLRLIMTNWTVRSKL